jgi:hypothetical protein
MGNKKLLREIFKKEVNFLFSPKGFTTNDVGIYNVGHKKIVLKKFKNYFSKRNEELFYTIFKKLNYLNIPQLYFSGDDFKK